ncbi:F-box associated domain-containing protein [Caenorhabditis elegans]|uniref:F-box associated domain-containing protein n=1 Tax=Caenorhabditis elegans TaxID=6239 RepID=Q8WTM1_CAEEL|nr:F-box associated domain-containing protein [Caenorhabditis elegans]CCD72811.2 F-box associated domain-containing protein [Caenorhabditis elegans]|eukprot:NP_500131.3 Uncharacterized protein CELE_Y41D4A.3 [Caenorhabditis elegans]
MVRNVSIPFQLLKLPQKSIVYVLHRLLIADLIGFSLISQTAKERTKHLGLKAKCVCIGIDSQISILISLQHDQTRFIFYTNEYRNPEHRLEEEESIKMSIDTRLGEWKTPKCCVKQFLDHVFEIFHEKTKVLSLRFTTDHYENALFDDLGGLEIEYFYMHSSPNSKSLTSQRALKQFSRAAKIINISHNPFPTESSIELQRILIRNMGMVQLNRPMNYTLNDLFVTNASTVQAQIPVRDVNTFLKHWIRGIDRNFHFAYFFFEDHELEVENAIEELFKNVNYQVAPAERLLILYPIGYQEILHKGGYDVRRIDGTEATMDVYRNRAWMYISSY